MRPFASEFFSAVSNETRTLIGFWTGATSVKKAKVLLSELKRGGINTKLLFCWIPALPGCKTRKCFVHTTKPIWIKPISVLQRQILPKFKQVSNLCIHSLIHHTHSFTTLTHSLTTSTHSSQIILLDDNIEKMQGIFNSSTGKVSRGIPVAYFNILTSSPLILSI